MKNLLLIFFIKSIAIFPWLFIRILWNLVGRFVYYSHRREVHDARVNLSIAFPDMKKNNLEDLLKKSLCENAITFFEMPKIWLRKSNISKKVDANGLPEKMHELTKKGKGLILACPHHGNWEMVPYGVDKNLKITALYRPPRNKILEPIMNQGRSKYINMVPTSISGIKALHRALKNDDVILILPDQVPKLSGSAAIKAPFFGRESITMSLLSKLAAKHQAPVLVVWAERKLNKNYKMKFFEIGDDIRAKNPEISALALNKAIEECVISSPSQYQWSYRRYASRLSNEVSPYDYKI